MRYLRSFLCILFVLLCSGLLRAQTQPAYLDPALPVEERVDDLLGRMTLEEKIGQMTLIEKNSIKNPTDIATFYLGGLLSGGGGYPRDNTPAGWYEMVSGFDAQARQTRLGIPLLYGVDAVHGHNNLRGAVIFPHNIGLGATRNADLVRQIGQITADEMLATGICWNYAPVVAVPQDVRWGRTYEGYSENTALVTELAVAFLTGLQGDGLRVLGTPKHFIGDGGTTWGTSTTGDFMIDQGVTEYDEAALRELFLPPYQAVIQSGAMSIMVSFSSYGGMKMHAQKYLLTDVLKGESGFTGFLVSDWGGIDQINPADYYASVVTAINAGIDMNMVPYDYQRFVTTLQKAIAAGDISPERVDDAVRRILRVKFLLGLFEDPCGDPALQSEVGSAAHRALAREAVAQSLVLLQNNNGVLPLSKDTPLIFVAGEGARDIGIQSGGWTIEWQGKPGNITPGTTILEGIEQAVSPETRVVFDRLARFRNATDEQGNPLTADAGIVVLAEKPYAEGPGDRADLHLTAAEIALVQNMRQRAKIVVVILISGRPLIIPEALRVSDAFVAAWLPGTEGAGIADVLFGDKPFTGKLPFTFPRSMAQLPLAAIHPDATGCDGPLFPFGYGLTAADKAMVVPEECDL